MEAKEEKKEEMEEDASVEYEEELPKPKFYETQRRCTNTGGCRGKKANEVRMFGRPRFDKTGRDKSWPVTEMGNRGKKESKKKKSMFLSKISFIFIYFASFYSYSLTYFLAFVLV